MPSEKRERQRAGREARREAAKAAQRRAQRRRQVIALVALFAAILGIGLLLNVRGGDDEGEQVTAGNETDTTEQAGRAEFGDEPCPPTEGEVERRTSFAEAPANCLQEGEDYKATVETDVGTFEIDLNEDDAPVTVNNFVFLARYRAYEGVPFHRVIPDFVVQGGDVEKGDGTGGPGYQFADELPEAGEYELGSVAMANSGPDTNGSQFFVITGENGVALPPNYSLFGKVTQGLDVVEKIEADGSPSGTPSVVHKIVKVTITAD